MGREKGEPALPPQQGKIICPQSASLLQQRESESAHIRKGGGG